MYTLPFITIYIYLYIYIYIYWGLRPVPPVPILWLVVGWLMAAGWSACLLQWALFCDSNGLNPGVLEASGATTGCLFGTIWEYLGWQSYPTRL